MKFDFQHTKYIADLLTLARFVLGLVLAILGIANAAPEGLQLAVMLVLLGWLTDLLDGRLARRDLDARETWLGRHEAEADLSISMGVGVFLVFSGYIPIWLGVLILVVLPAVWLLHSYQLDWPMYALPYVFLLIAAFEGAPLNAGLMVGYLVFTLVIQFSRFSGEHLPEFFQSFRKNDQL